METLPMAARAMRKIATAFFVALFLGGILYANAATYGSGIYGSELYSSDTPDTTPPVRSSGSPSGTLAEGVLGATLSLSTDESATCKYGTTANTAYVSIANTFTTTGSTSHSVQLANLSPSTTYTYYIRCIDGSSNPNTDDYSITFTTSSNPTTNRGGSTPINYGLSRPQPLPIPTRIFNVNLAHGARNEDVRALQRFLNTNGFPIALSGVASLGNETTYFGLATKSALMKFQAAHGIPATGNLGPMTRAVINTKLNAPQVPAWQTVSVTAINLNVRISPGGPVIGMVQQGTTGYVLGTYGNWLRVRFPSVEGYVYKAFLK